MHVPGQNHRDPWFADFYKKCLSDLKMVFGTRDGTTIIFPGTGTGGWESALTNTLSPGDKVVTFRYGLFSHLWIDMMQRLGLDVTVIEGRWGDGAYEDKLAEVLKADTGKKIKAVCVVHNETTTGVTSDIPEVRGAGGAASGGRAASSERVGRQHALGLFRWYGRDSERGPCKLQPSHASVDPHSPAGPARRCARRWTRTTTPPCCWWMGCRPLARWTSSLTSGASTWR